MAIKFEEILKFTREHGDVRGWAREGGVTLLKSGDTDTVTFWEEDAVRFEHAGRSYSRDEFEKFMRSKVEG